MIVIIGLVPDEVGNALASPIHTPGVSCSSPYGFATLVCGFRLFSAHQMGTCRMGADPQTSVANPYGELHDTPGVWIGDASAFPTASGTNPMITIMALAHRTGEAILTTVQTEAVTA